MLFKPKNLHYPFFILNFGFLYIWLFMIIRMFLLFGLLSQFVCLKAQQKDSLRVSENLEEQHSPHKASIMSLVLPGLGQVYNKKYWKVPIIYAGMGASLYYAFEERSLFREFKEAYLKRVDDDPQTEDLKYANYTNQNMLSLIDYHRRSRDIFFILTGVVYALNIVDAAVDAHLFYFDVSDDLSASIRPQLLPDPTGMGFTPALKLNLKLGKLPLSTYSYH